MIFRHGIYKTLRKFDNNLGLHSVTLTSCIVAYLYICFRNVAFFLLLFFFILGIRHLPPHHCIQGEWWIFILLLNSWVVKAFAQEGGKIKGLLNLLLARPGARLCSSLPLNQSCCAKYSARLLRPGQRKAKDRHGMASHSLWSSAAGAEWRGSEHCLPSEAISFPLGVWSDHASLTTGWP